MSGSTFISLLTTGFGLLSAAIVLAVLYRFRRAPIVYLLRSVERRSAGHRDAMAALGVALAGARADGNRTMFDYFAQQYRQNHAALLELDPKADRRVAANLVFDDGVGASEGEVRRLRA